MDRRSFLLAASAAAATATFTRACAASAKTPQAFGAIPDGRADSTQQLQAMLDAGGDIRWTAGAYRAGGLMLRSNTRIVFDPGVSIVGMNGQNGVLRAQNITNLTLQGAANIVGPAGLTSHAVSLWGVKRATLQGLRISGGGQRKDALYIGPGNGACEDIHIDGCTLQDGRRNNLSITACRDFIIENCDVSGANGAPGSGIDVEANTHGVIGRGIIRNNRVHDNQRYGILIAFGDDIAISGNQISGNGLPGIAVAAGSSQWNEGVFRPGLDITGVSFMDPLTGRLRVGHPQNIEVGAIVSFQARNGRSRPRELAAHARYMVIEKDAAGTLTLSVDGYTPITRLTPDDWGRLDADPVKTDLRMRIQTEGQASNVEIYNNRIGRNGGLREIDLSTSVGVRVHDNDINAGADRTGIFVAYGRRLSIVNNRLHGSLASTSPNSRGLHLGTCSQVEHRGNHIDSFGYAGILAGGVAGYEGIGDTIINCGWLPQGACVRLDRIREGRLAGEVASNDPKHPANFGIYAPESTLAGTTVEHNDLHGSGAAADKRLAIADPAARIGSNTL